MYPKDLRYSREHEWVRVEGDLARVGITYYAQEALGDVVYVELPIEGDSVQAGESLGTAESVKAVSEIYAPVSGEVVEVNETLEDKPELLNKDPYGEGWLVVLKMSDADELEKLMDAGAYEEYLKTLD